MRVLGRGIVTAATARPARAPEVTVDRTARSCGRSSTDVL